MFSLPVRANYTVPPPPTRLGPYAHVRLDRIDICFCMFTILILNSQSAFNYNCYQEPRWLFKIRMIVNMQKYVVEVVNGL